MFDKLKKSFYICLVPNGGGRPEEDGRNRESGGALSPIPELFPQL